MKLTLKMTSGLFESIRLSLNSGEVIEFTSIGGSMYEAQLSSGQVLFNHQAGDAHNFVGFLELPGPCPRPQPGCINMLANVRTADMPDVPVVMRGTDMRASRNIVNLQQTDPQINSHPDIPMLQRFYEDFADRFDFIALVDSVRSARNTSYRGLRNETIGIGLPVFDSATAYGSPDRLVGTVMYANDNFFDLAAHIALHEIGHRWINFLDATALEDGNGPHWPLSDVAYGIMGFSIPPTGQGGSFPWGLTVQEDGDVLVEGLPFATEFNDLELYMMGLIGPSEVADHFALPDQDYSDVRGGAVLPGPVEWVSIQDVIATHGMRWPPAGVSPSAFNIGTIVVSSGDFLNADEMAFFDFMASRANARRELTYTSGLAGGVTKPFFLATGKRATLSSSMIGQLDRLAIGGDVNGDGSTDLSLLVRDRDEGSNRVILVDGAGGTILSERPFGAELTKGHVTVPDFTDDSIPESAVLFEGVANLFARVKDPQSGAFLRKPRFDPALDTFAFLSTGDVDDDGEPDVAVVGREIGSARVTATLRSAESGTFVGRINFSPDYEPFDAVVIDDIAGSPAKEIAVLGVDATGRVRAQIKDLRTGDLINHVFFDRDFDPMGFAAFPDLSGDTKLIGVLGRNDDGVIRAEIKQASNGVLIGRRHFNGDYTPVEFLAFGDAEDGASGGAVVVLGVNGNGLVRAQVRKVNTGELINVVAFGRDFEPVEAITLTGAAGNARNEIALLGVNAAGQEHIQIRDLLTGQLVSSTELE